MTVKKHGSTEQNLLPPIAVVILAGGQSARMARNKATLPDPHGGERTMPDLIYKGFLQTLSAATLEAPAEQHHEFMNLNTPIDFFSHVAPDG